MKKTNWNVLKVSVIAAGVLLSAAFYTSSDEGNALINGAALEETENSDSTQDRELAKAAESKTEETSENIEEMVRRIVQEELLSMQQEAHLKAQDEEAESAGANDIDTAKEDESAGRESEPNGKKADAGAGVNQGAQTSGKRAASSSDCLNLNTASKEELMELPGIGASRAEAIIAYRNTYGGFGYVEEVMNIRGIKEAAFAKIKDRICVS